MRRSTSKVVFVVVTVMTVSFMISGFLIFWTISSVSLETIDQPDEIYCATSFDCVRKQNDWVSPGPECLNGSCQCPSDSCVHYTVGNWGYVKYYCGTCGSLGSWCASDASCDSPGLCRDDNFCRCPIGEVQYEICVHNQPVSTSKKSLILISVLVLILILGRIIAWRNHILRLLRVHRWPFFEWCCRAAALRERERQNQRDNRPDNEKTAAFTVSSRDFIATSNDPDLDWALELSRQLRAQDDADDIQTSTEATDQAHQRGNTSSDSPPNDGSIQTNGNLEESSFHSSLFRRNISSNPGGRNSTRLSSTFPSRNYRRNGVGIQNSETSRNISGTFPSRTHKRNPLDAQTFSTTEDTSGNSDHFNAVNQSGNALRIDSENDSSSGLSTVFPETTFSIQPPPERSA